MNRYEDAMILIKFVPWHFFLDLAPHPHPFLLLYNPPEFQFFLIFILNIILTSGPSQHIFPLQFVFLFLEKTIHHCILVFLNLSFAAKVNFLSKGDATVIHAAQNFSVSFWSHIFSFYMTHQKLYQSEESHPAFFMEQHIQSAHSFNYLVPKSYQLLNYFCKLPNAPPGSGYGTVLLLGSTPFGSGVLSVTL